MQEASYTLYSSAWQCYVAQNFFFPLMGAVLEQKQEGRLFANAQGTGFYVEHAFGFAQLFGDIDVEFAKDLQKYFEERKAFAVPKVRLYAPESFAHMNFETLAPFKAIRQRFFPAEQETLPMSLEHVQVLSVDARNFDAMEENFRLATRFWRSEEEFVLHSHAKMLLYKGQIAALCYAAAVANKQAEIDVVTLPEFHQKGFGKIVTQAFIAHCCKRDILPLWDCFTNNIGSMKLQESLGFMAKNPPYPFYTLPKMAE